MDWLWQGFYHAATMAWETFWALVLGFGISASLQVLISKEKMARFFGRTNLRSMTLATGLGAASSSCSYAAAAAARSAFAQGAALTPALAFMFASTNLVVELGAVLWLLMGWRFLLAEFVGSFVLILLMWGLARLVFPETLEADARSHADARGDEASGCCHHSHDGHDDAPRDPDGESTGALEHHPDNGDRDLERESRLRRMAAAFVMDWQMLWKEIVIGFLIAGFLAALVPNGWWKSLFLQTGPDWLRLVENAVVGPLIAVASFVCSVGNIPLASVLWSGGIGFGGVISFIFADLLIVPLIVIYRKSFGNRAAAYITGVFFVSMVGAGIIVDLLFRVCGLVPAAPPSASIVEHARFSWNYTTWLDFVALAVGGWLLLVHSSSRGIGENHEHDEHQPAPDGI